VPESVHQTSVFRFGLYELDSQTGELRKDGKQRPSIQGQPLEILIHLLERPGDVVTRDELRLLLWPVDTFVDYDHSLNAAVNKLRDALSDSADNPRFIQTIPRRGYRFIASVQVVADSAAPPAEIKPEAAVETLPPVPSPAEAAEKRNFVLSDAYDLPDAPQVVVRILFSLIQVMYLSFYIFSLARIEQVQPLLAQAVQNPKWLFVLLLGTYPRRFLAIAVCP
jgi:DNA-binding winged helix-turn-helix (wHTH) protein